MLHLRDYQEEAVEAVIAEARQGVRRQLVVIPTGGGKTLIVAALSQKAHGRVLMLVHRDELIEQSVEKFGWVWPEEQIGVVKAERDEHDRRVVVASVQTLAHKRRRDRLNAREFSLVIGHVSVMG
jgi:superfamily II DNA or RNA helicase